MTTVSGKEKIFRFWGILLLVFSIMTLMGCIHQVSPGRVVREDDNSDQKQKGFYIPPKKVVTFTVIGKGVEPEKGVSKGQAFILSERAAVLDGYRLLTEKLKGVYVDAFTQAGMNVIDHDQINTQSQAILRGAKITEVVHKEYGITEVIMQVRVNFTQFDMIWWPDGLSERLAYRSIVTR